MLEGRCPNSIKSNPLSLQGNPRYTDHMATMRTQTAAVPVHSTSSNPRGPLGVYKPATKCSNPIYNLRMMFGTLCGHPRTGRVPLFAYWSSKRVRAQPAPFVCHNYRPFRVARGPMGQFGGLRFRTPHDTRERGGRQGEGNAQDNEQDTRVVRSSRLVHFRACPSVHRPLTSTPMLQ